MTTIQDDASVVRVAQALLEYDRVKNGPGFLHISWAERSAIGREEYLGPARAAVAALNGTS